MSVQRQTAFPLPFNTQLPSTPWLVWLLLAVKWAWLAMGTTSVKTVAVIALLLVLCVLVFHLHMTPAPPLQACDCSHSSGNQEKDASQPSPSHHDVQKTPPIKFLSYQPPGNGWNNQRIAMENALVLAKLLNRTLLVHPLAPHELGNKLKAGLSHGYLAYNKLHTHQLLPPSQFLDLELMSQVIPVQEVAVSHPEFLARFGHLTWRNICHTPGYGFWVDQQPQTAAEVDMLSRQQFTSLGHVWREKCPKEKLRAEKDPTSIPLIRYVSDLQQIGSEMLYFERGTLFGIHIRFTSRERAMQAQKWVVEHVRYNIAIWKVVGKVHEMLGNRYNAIQVRRKNHMDSKLPPSYWIGRMIEMNYSKSVPVYVATDDADEEWFNPFQLEGYKLYFTRDMSHHLSFLHLDESLRNDFVALHEQCLCISAAKFVGSPASTFNAFILRQRREGLHVRDGLIVDTLHTYWIGHRLHAHARDVFLQEH